MRVTDHEIERIGVFLADFEYVQTHCLHRDPGLYDFLHHAGRFG